MREGIYSQSRSMVHGKNQLEYHADLLRELVEEFREYARQVAQEAKYSCAFNAHIPPTSLTIKMATLDEIFWLPLRRKASRPTSVWLVKEEGFTTVRRGSDNELLKALVKEGDLPGAIWRQGLFTGAAPQ